MRFLVRVQAGATGSCYNDSMPYKSREKQNKYQIEWAAARKKQWLQLHGPCAKCGSSIRLEVDHIDRTQKVSHRVWSWRSDKREAELAKCQVLCHECHLIKTRSERVNLNHGTTTNYRNGCRCKDCTDAHSKAARIYRSKISPRSQIGKGTRLVCTKHP